MGDLTSVGQAAFSVRRGGERFPCKEMERKVMPSGKNRGSDGLRGDNELGADLERTSKAGVMGES